MRRVLRDVIQPIEALSVEDLRQLRTCSREQKADVHSTRIHTPSTRFLEAGLLGYRCAMICPSPREVTSWFHHQFFVDCSSPFCDEIAGPWIPSSRDEELYLGPWNPSLRWIPSIDSAHGSLPVWMYMENHPGYRYVACSNKCHRDVERILVMRRELDEEHEIVIGVWNYHEPTGASFAQVCPFCHEPNPAHSAFCIFDSYRRDAFQALQAGTFQRWAALYAIAIGAKNR